MKPFMDKDFLLDTANRPRALPRVCRKGPDYRTTTATLARRKSRKTARLTISRRSGLAGDHYKWRQMRSNGVEERYITGDAPDREKFQKWAETLEMAIGNPLFHWSHLELQRYFDYHGVLTGETAEEVWNLCNEKLRSPDMRARSLIERSNVKLLCTTDDPADDLHWHAVIRDDPTFSVKVLPAWRPDKVLHIEKADFAPYL